jgi:hypothetical protein
MVRWRISLHPLSQAGFIDPAAEVKMPARAQRAGKAGRPTIDSYSLALAKTKDGTAAPLPVNFPLCGKLATVVVGPGREGASEKFASKINRSSSHCEHATA